MFFLLAYLNCLTTNTLKLLRDFEDKKNDLQDLCKLNVETVNLSIVFILHLRLTAPKTVVAVYSFRSIGVGHTLLTKLCGFLNMPPTMTKNAYECLLNSIKVASKQVPEKSMSDAVARLRGTEQTADVEVSVDVTCQRIDFSSTVELVTAISIDNGRVLDVAILSKSCKGCTSMKKLPLLIPLVMRHGSYLIIIILIMPAPPLEWKQQELLRSLVHKKRSMDYHTHLFMEMVTAKHILLSKIYIVQVNLLRNLNVSVTTKNLSVRGFVIWKKKGVGGKGKLTNTKIDTM